MFRSKRVAGGAPHSGPHNREAHLNNHTAKQWIEYKWINLFLIVEWINLFLIEYCLYIIIKIVSVFWLTLERFSMEQN